jgi:hypothetical protein
MSGYQQENPYASPEGAAEAAVAEIHGIWRDGDELVLMPGEMKAPRACWITNRTSRVRPMGANCGYTVYGWLSFLAVVPVVGFILYFCVILGLWWTGYERRHRFRFWLSSRCFGRLFMIGFPLTFCWLLGSFMSNVALFLGDSLMGIIAVVLVSVGSWFIVWRDSVLLGFRVRGMGNGTIRVRGVHHDYLARLPDYPDSVGPSE